MTVVVLGVDALDPELVDPSSHPNLVLDSHHTIQTIDSSAGDPSTHELWPTIITGLEPAEHGLVLDDGVAWENRLLAAGSRVADYLLPDAIQNRIGAWLLTNTSADAFRVPASYYEERGISTVFDGRQAKPIGIPNYVVAPESEDREHQLRRNMGDLFERDPETEIGHSSADPMTFYEQCMEMAMIRIARIRRGLRSRNYELVFGYTSGLDLIGHVSYDRPSLQRRAYEELNELVGELRADLDDNDDLLLVSDHGLQEGIHTHKAMVASTDPDLVDRIESVVDVRAAIDRTLDEHAHIPESESTTQIEDGESEAIEEHLEDLGYF